MIKIINFISSRFIELTALIISLINLYLYYKTIKDEKVDFKIEQTNDAAYSFGFLWYQEHHILFFHVSIENLSKTETSITEIFIEDKSGNTYVPTLYELGDLYNKDGISLFDKTNESFYYRYDLKSNNLLHNLRIQAYGNISGYLVFFGFPLINKKEYVRLKVHTPKRKFSQDIQIYPLPENIKPQYPI